MSKSLKSRLGALERSTGRQPGSPIDMTKPESASRGSSSDKKQERQTSFDEHSDKDSPDNSELSGLQRFGFSYEHDETGGFWHRALSFDVLSSYGNVRYQDVLSRDLSLLARACKLVFRNSEDRAVSLRIENLRFYDTETTGLGTGAGTFPFLHAIGQIEEDEWVIHQYFVDDFSEEPALLAAMVRRHFDADAICVSFNGKSFDWPLFNNRLILYRLPMPGATRQMDLLHPSRRLWRRKLGRVTLGNLESAVLGVERSDDLPGREAPARYFAYAADKAVERIRPVLDHNAADVSALLGLTVILADRLNGYSIAESAGEYAALAAWYDEWQENDLAESCLVSAMDCPDATWREYWLASLHFKRLGQWARACKLWESMAQRFSWSTMPLVELAKYCEHRQRDYDKALAWTESALQRCQPVPGLPTVNSEAIIAALRHRRNRILRKSAKR